MMGGGFRQLADSDRRSRVGEAAEVWSSVHAPTCTDLFAKPQAGSAELRFKICQRESQGSGSFSNVHSLNISHPESGPVKCRAGPVAVF